MAVKITDRFTFVPEFCLCATATSLFLMISSRNYRLKLWEKGGAEGWNSSPSQPVRCDPNCNQPPKVPLVWSQELVDATLAVAILSAILMLARFIMGFFEDIATPCRVTQASFVISALATLFYTARFIGTNVEVARVWRKTHGDDYQLITEQLDEERGMGREEAAARERERHLYREALSPEDDNKEDDNKGDGDKDNSDMEEDNNKDRKGRL
ncbi:hypothetical protein CGCF415_v002772 [Colletotrichum fructicola]|uniref:Uncharacterized protein n=1 Tax=Colletotrichum fructicola (strain Nara gc5) TaxID=1213859 RepID=A0A7J6J6F6_COLFN|nr:hypothetical protein CFRS1_v011368 [Colletotrichum fructicola]KAF4485295.1 hypothetical protein CGGC5_v006913 [Colletotrichum fructicola Nara gc5]KAF4902918.1 hypothetical protein CGCFRS4_v001965 [Colletotrichum fructicola]KAF4913639.1 hypothetical protein CGCF415_v002772 [Colletotrichum fructicola]KAF4938122.1 hypothetical protein CGCF245_v004895 [Colletotrichum fructicola]